MRKFVFVSQLVAVGVLGCNAFDPAPPHEHLTPETPVATVFPLPPATATGTVPQTPCGFRQDADGDGFTIFNATGCAPGSVVDEPTPETDDCNDYDFTRHIGVAWGVDSDGDGYGSGAPVWRCDGETIEGYVDNFDDCDDSDASAQTPQYRDRDGDGAGAPARCAECVGNDAAGYAPNMNDCDDLDARTVPAALEVSYDGVDNNCDGYDVIFDNVGASPLPIFSDAAWCSGAALAVVAVHRSGSFTMVLEIGNVGTGSTNGSFTLWRETTNTIIQTTPLPALEPGQTYLTNELGPGTYRVRLTYDGRGAGREGAVTGETTSDLATSEAQEVGTSTGAAASSEASTDGLQGIAPPIETDIGNGTSGSTAEPIASESTGFQATDVESVVDASTLELSDAGVAESVEAGIAEPEFDGPRCDLILDDLVFVVPAERAL